TDLDRPVQRLRLGCHGSKQNTAGQNDQSLHQLLPNCHQSLSDVTLKSYQSAAGGPTTASISIFISGKASRLTSIRVLAGLADPKNSCRTGLIAARSLMSVKNTVTLST